MDIFVAKAGVQAGPFPIERVQGLVASGEYSPADLGWHSGLPGWIPLGNILSTQAPVAAQPMSVAPPALDPGMNPTGKATAGLVLGIFGLIAWFIPLFGLPTTIVGLVMSVKGMKSTSRGKAIAGLVLSIIGLVLTVINAALGAYLGATGQNPLVNRLLGH